MKGLLIKDIRLMKSQGAVLLGLLVIVAIFMGFVSDVSPSFVVTIYHDFSVHFYNYYDKL